MRIAVGRALAVLAARRRVWLGAVAPTTAVRVPRVPVTVGAVAVGAVPRVVLVAVIRRAHRTGAGHVSGPRGWPGAGETDLARTGEGAPASDIAGGGAGGRWVLLLLSAEEVRARLRLDTSAALVSSAASELSRAVEGRRLTRTHDLPPAPRRDGAARGAPIRSQRPGSRLARHAHRRRTAHACGTSALASAPAARAPSSASAPCTGSRQPTSEAARPQATARPAARRCRRVGRLARVRDYSTRTRYRAPEQMGRSAHIEPMLTLNA